MNFKERYNYNPKTDLIGKGGFSKVFKAKDTLLSRDVALKVFTSETAGKYDLIKEIQKVINLNHPNLCRYFDVAVLDNVTAFGEEEKVQIGVMEYLEAGDLRQYYSQHNDSLKKLLTDVLRGLAFLHKKRIIHRDLKPQNILVTETDEGALAKITDFGISKAIDSGFSSSMLLGTIEYMAPEQFNPERYGINGEINTNLDLWSFGLMVYDLLTKESLFGGRAGSTSAEQVMSKILSDDYYDKLNRLPEPYRTVTKKCLVKNANERINSAEDVIEILTNGVQVRSEETELIETKPKKKERSGLTSPPVLQKEVPDKTPHKSLVKPLPIMITIGAIILTVIIIASSSKSNSSRDNNNYIDYSPDTTVTTASYSTATDTAPVDYEQKKDSTRK